MNEMTDVTSPSAERRLVEREILIEARPETVWRLLTDPRQATRWMGRAASFDLRPGGEYRVEVLPGHVALGEFAVIEPYRRLVFTWGWQGADASSVPPGSTTVSFELLPRGQATLVRLCHRDLPHARAATSHGRGWEHYLERLIAVASGREPGADPWLIGGMP